MQGRHRIYCTGQLLFNHFVMFQDRFPDKADLLRNMMGLLGNVAEVPSLRHKLMTKEFVEEFAFLLDSCSDGKTEYVKYLCFYGSILVQV